MSSSYFPRQRTICLKIISHITMKVRRLKVVYVCLFIGALIALITHYGPYAVVVNRINASLVCILSSERPGVKNVLEKLNSQSSTDFQVIEDGSTYGYSAYVDDRPTRDRVPYIGLISRVYEHITTLFTASSQNNPSNSDNLPVLRVFVYMLNDTNPLDSWGCVLYYSKPPSSQTLVVPVVAVTDLDIAPSRRYRVVMLLCAMPGNSSLPSPSHISVVTKQYLMKYSNLINSTDSVTDWANNRNTDDDVYVNSRTYITEHCNIKSHTFSNSTMKWIYISNDMNIIPIRDLRKERDNKDRSLIVNFTVCLSPIFNGIHGWQDIVKFIEVNKALGANRFIFHISSSVRKSLKKFLLNYSLDATRGSTIEIYPFNPINSEGLHYNGQIVCITDCLYRTMYRTRYMISQDLDELIVPMRTNTWSDMMHRLNAQHPGKSVAVANFRSVWFPVDSKDDPVYGNGSAAVIYNILPLLKVTRDSFLYPHKDRSKVLVRPESVLIVHVHYIENQNVIDRDNNPSIHVSETEGILFHYRNITINSDKAVKNIRLREYADVIQERVTSEIKYFSVE